MAVHHWQLFIPITLVALLVSSTSAQTFAVANAGGAIASAGGLTAVAQLPSLFNGNAFGISGAPSYNPYYYPQPNRLPIQIGWSGVAQPQQPFGGVGFMGGLGNPYLTNQPQINPFLGGQPPAATPLTNPYLVRQPPYNNPPPVGRLPPQVQMPQKRPGTQQPQHKQNTTQQPPQQQQSNYQQKPNNQQQQNNNNKPNNINNQNNNINRNQRPAQHTNQLLSNQNRLPNNATKNISNNVGTTSAEPQPAKPRPTTHAPPPPDTTRHPLPDDLIASIFDAGPNGHPSTQIVESDPQTGGPPPNAPIFQPRPPTKAPTHEPLRKRNDFILPDSMLYIHRPEAQEPALYAIDPRRRRR